VYALDANDGRLMWTYNSSIEMFFFQLVVGIDGTLFAAGENVLYAIDGVTGVLRWSSELCNPLFSMATTSDGKLVCFTQYRSLLITDGQTGALLWTYESSYAFPFSNVAIAPDGTLVVTGINEMYQQIFLDAFHGRTSLPWISIAL